VVGLDFESGEATICMAGYTVDSNRHAVMGFALYRVVQIAKGSEPGICQPITPCGYVRVLNQVISARFLGTGIACHD